MTYTTEGIIINSVLILGAVLFGILWGRLWEIMFSAPGTMLTDAIMTAKAIRRKLNG